MQFNTSCETDSTNTQVALNPEVHLSEARALLLVQVEASAYKYTVFTSPNVLIQDKEDTHLKSLLLVSRRAPLPLALV